ncbi:hypothetical protein Tco_1164892 [Tanacetum coccineum]
MIDIYKAYDTMSWDFLESALNMFEFPAQMVKWIMVCVITASFFININVPCHGDVKSVKVVKAALDEFSCFTGLNPNMGKSTVFFGNLKDDVKKEILKVLPFKVGKLPVTCLVYWASIFGLPNIIVKDINSLLKGFLCFQGDLSRGKAKIAWKHVYKPKTQGGHGIKDLSKWNEFLMGKHVWNFASNKESLWVKWINAVRLKGKRT